MQLPFNHIRRYSKQGNRKVARVRAGLISTLGFDQPVTSIYITNLPGG